MDLLRVFLACASIIAGQIPSALAADWVPNVKQVGDPKGNYLNVEITEDGHYMIWFEGVQGSATQGYMWHCMIDQKTGDLIPSDCRGFRAFESTSWGRANPGYDAEGPYYIGANTQGRLIMVRPTGATTGKVTVLSTPPDTRRRAVYPANLQSGKKDYVFFIQNKSTAGAGVRPANGWVELQYVDLAQPDRVHAIERQDTPARGFAPMDAGFVRWMRGRPIITFGHLSDKTGKVEIHGFDADHPERGTFSLIEDGANKIDPYPASIDGYEYVMAGINATATSHIYRRPAGGRDDAPFELYRTLYPDGSKLKDPSLAQSHEPFQFQGRLYTVYEVNDMGRGFFDTTFRQPGELWLADLSANPVKQWRIAPDKGGPITEPEPLVIGACAWIFYNRPMVEESAGQPNNQAGEQPRSIREVIRERLLGGSARTGFPRMALYRAAVPMCGKN
jgi:hypothetical protein